MLAAFDLQHVTVTHASFNNSKKLLSDKYLDCFSFAGENLRFRDNGSYAILPAFGPFLQDSFLHTNLRM